MVGRGGEQWEERGAYREGGWRGGGGRARLQQGRVRCDTIVLLARWRGRSGSPSTVACAGGGVMVLGVGFGAGDGDGVVDVGVALPTASWPHGLVGFCVHAFARTCACVRARGVRWLTISRRLESLVGFVGHYSSCGCVR